MQFGYYCVNPVLQRRVAKDGRSYTWDEFVQWYGAGRARHVWSECATLADYINSRVAQDGHRYTFDDFRHHYGDQAEHIWHNSANAATEHINVHTDGDATGHDEPSFPNTTSDEDAAGAATQRSNTAQASNNNTRKSADARTTGQAVLPSTSEQGVLILLHQADVAALRAEEKLSRRLV